MVQVKNQALLDWSHHKHTHSNVTVFPELFTCFVLACCLCKCLQRVMSHLSGCCFWCDCSLHFTMTLWAFLCAENKSNVQIAAHPLSYFPPCTWTEVSWLLCKCAGKGSVWFLFCPHLVKRFSIFAHHLPYFPLFFSSSPKLLKSLNTGFVWRKYRDRDRQKNNCSDAHGERSEGAISHI